MVIYEYDRLDTRFKDRLVGRVEPKGSIYIDNKNRLQWIAHDQVNIYYWEVIEDNEIEDIFKRMDLIL